MTATICMALSAIGIVIAVLTASRGRTRAALRWLAVALVPTGLYLTGLITVFHTIGSTLVHWATHLVFDPKVWVGVAMLAATVLILLGTGVRFGRGKRRGKEQGQVPAGGGKPSAPPGRPAGAALPAKSNPTADLGDFSDVEEILKRRGI
ncbi:hypothetical protein [Streptacidiphilus jiangxiensis]|uniref:Cellulose synthase n=1 Tax=Streptacidiphilus jiangxiensis TaxID=235985 RepID=A0A1H7ZHB8_STRJI|nr:hypothetical protein [Streptacidiphilus jiangxiensis]SEM57384.1 hypothetical protein SAMN05414137_1358 [Streptacidiphilus jiangxiensis]